MDPITASNLKKFKKEYDIEAYTDTTAFEHFACRVIYNKYIADSFSTEDIVTDIGEIGVDGIGILVDHKLVTSKQFVDDLFDSDDKSKEIEFIFLQAKTSDSFDTGELEKFFLGVKNFFADDCTRIKTNEGIENLVRIKDHIIENYSDRFNDIPSLYLYYVMCGDWDENYEASWRIEQQYFEKLGLFSKVKFIGCGKEEVRQAYRELKGRLIRTIPMDRKLNLPKINDTWQAVVGAVKCKDFLKLLKAEDGTMLVNIFEENVRDFQGMNRVNNEIQKSIKNENEQNIFALLNNGITILTKELKVGVDDITLENYQIANGCQTSNVLFKNASELNDNAYIILKIIATDVHELAERITYTNNDQTEVKREAFETTKEFHKKLEEYYNAMVGGRIPNLYYERRSKQYDSNNEINKNDVVSLSLQTKAYVAVVMNEPENVNGYYGMLLRNQSTHIYQGEVYELYYMAAYLVNFVEKQLRVVNEAKGLGWFKYHIACMIKILMCGNLEKPDNEKYKMRLVKALNKRNVYDRKTLEELFMTSVQILRECLSETRKEGAEYRRNYRYQSNLNQDKTFAKTVLDKTLETYKKLEKTSPLEPGVKVYGVVQYVKNGICNVKLLMKGPEIKAYFFVDKNSNIKAGQEIEGILVKNVDDKWLISNYKLR